MTGYKLVSKSHCVMGNKPGPGNAEGRNKLSTEEKVQKRLLHPRNKDSLREKKRKKIPHG